MGLGSPESYRLSCSYMAMGLWGEVSLGSPYGIGVWQSVKDPPKSYGSGAAWCPPLWPWMKLVSMVL